MAFACEITVGSACAWSDSTSCRISRNLGFSLSESGVGGSLVVVPMASAGLGGVVDTRERRWLLNVRSSGEMY